MFVFLHIQFYLIWSVAQFRLVRESGTSTHTHTHTHNDVKGKSTKYRHWDIYTRLMHTHEMQVHGIRYFGGSGMYAHTQLYVMKTYATVMWCVPCLPF